MRTLEATCRQARAEAVGRAARARDEVLERRGERREVGVKREEGARAGEHGGARQRELRVAGEGKGGEGEGVISVVSPSAARRSARRPHTRHVYICTI